MPPRRGRTLLWLLALLLLALNALLLLAPPAWLERVWFASVWPLWPASTALLQALVPWPITVPVLLLLSLGLVVWAAWRPPRGRRVVLTILVWTTLLAATFVPTWGAAYRRVPLATTLELATTGAQRDTLLVALEQLVERVGSDAPTRPLALEIDRAALDDAVAAAARCVASADAFVSGREVALPTSVRRLREGTLLRTGYAGISLPWLLEPHVDAGLPTAAWLTVATHELTHAAGWAREADTDALSVLAGLRCGHPWVRYASALHGVQVVSTSLRPLVSDGSAEEARMRSALAALPAVAHDDRAALRAAVDRWYAPTVAHAVSRVYDGYLRSQGVSDGIADYAAAGALVGAALAACGSAVDAPWCH